MYGTQTAFSILFLSIMFENDVKMYGTQTYGIHDRTNVLFENDVKMYGTQTSFYISFTL